MPEFCILPPVTVLHRYTRLYAAFARYSPIREMGFRLRFLLRCLVHLVWIALYLAFFDVLFRHVQRLGDWDEAAYLLFQGTYLLLNSLVNGRFLSNAADLADRIRTGDLDAALAQPVDAQFLLTCRRVDLALLPQSLLGGILVLTAVANLAVPWALLDALAYLLLVGAGLLLLYGCVVVLASAAFWLVSREVLFDLWLAVMEVVRVPPDLLGGNALVLPAALRPVPAPAAVPGRQRPRPLRGPPARRPLADRPARAGGGRVPGGQPLALPAVPGLVPQRRQLKRYCPHPGAGVERPERAVAGVVPSDFPRVYP
jgi:ABC-2 type transport system permease protein